MIRYDFYRVSEETFCNCSGAKYRLKCDGYMTTDSGEGVFRADGRQLTGNAQFCGDEKKLLRWLNAVNKFDGTRFFSTERGARVYANRMTKKNPLTRLPTPQYTPGTIVGYDCGERARVVSQDNDNLTVEIDAVCPESGATVKTTTQMRAWDVYPA